MRMPLPESFRTPVPWYLRSGIWEVANAMLVGERRGRCDQADTSRWTAYLGSLSIEVDEPQGTRVIHDVVALARAHAFSAYDAAYLELALRRGLPVATLDKPLQAAAAAVGVMLFDPSA
jgi:predicted nucleic acid-binding protein